MSEVYIVFIYSLLENDREREREAESK